MTAELERAVEVMDRLRSPGGCPWDAAQTHESLARYLLEETYEVLEAIDTGDPLLLREELGDLLLQVLFHARLAQELAEGERFSIADVADDLVAKLIRRHPHVFAGTAGMDGMDGMDGTAGTAGMDGTDGMDGMDGTGATDPAAVNERWEADKAAEKGRTSATDGVPLAQPALALSAKLVTRARRAGIDVQPQSGDDIGERLFAVVRDAVAAGVDPEGALRHTANSYRAAIHSAELARP